MRILKAIVITVLVLLLANSPALADCLGDGTVSIIVNDNGKEAYNIKDVPWIKGATARVAMLNATDKEPSFKFESESICPYGDFVTKIGDTQAGQEEFWAFKINGSPTKEGIDMATLNNGDVISWEILPAELKSSNSESSNITRSGF